MIDFHINFFDSDEISMLTTLELIYMFFFFQFVNPEREVFHLKILVQRKTSNS